MVSLPSPTCMTTSVQDRVSTAAHTDELLSSGFGFVEVSSPEVAAAAIRKLQGSMLDHHKLSLQLSKHKPATAAAAGKKGWVHWA